MVGVAANGLAMVAQRRLDARLLPALAAAGSRPGRVCGRPSVPSAHLDSTSSSCSTVAPSADIIPFPVPLLANVVSIGDVLISVGLGWFVFATLLRGDPEPAPGGHLPVARRATPRHGSWRSDRADDAGRVR